MKSVPGEHPRQVPPVSGLHRVGGGGRLQEVEGMPVHARLPAVLLNEKKLRCFALVPML
jgi:hypothetical protein